MFAPRKFCDLSFVFGKLISVLFNHLECCLTLADLLLFPAAEFNLMLGETYSILNNSRK